MNRPDQAPHNPPAAGLFCPIKGAERSAHSAVPTETVSAFARLFASSEAKHDPSSPLGDGGACFA